MTYPMILLGALFGIQFISEYKIHFSILTAAVNLKSSINSSRCTGSPNKM